MSSLGEIGPMGPFGHQTSRPWAIMFANPEPQGDIQASGEVRELASPGLSSMLDTSFIIFSVSG